MVTVTLAFVLNWVWCELEIIMNRNLGNAMHFKRFGNRKGHDSPMIPSAIAIRGHLQPLLLSQILIQLPIHVCTYTYIAPLSNISHLYRHASVKSAVRVNVCDCSRTFALKRWNIYRASPPAIYYLASKSMSARIRRRSVESNTYCPYVSIPGVYYGPLTKVIKHNSLLILEIKSKCIK